MRSERVLTLCLLSAAAMLWAACQQDPYRIRTLEDAGPTGDGWPDLWVMQDGQQPSDAVTEGGTVDQLVVADACVPFPEICNNADDDCDGQTDEDFDKLTNPLYCDNCKGCMWLSKKPNNAYPDCINGACAIKSCFMGWIDLNGQVSDGCEYECIKTGVEICDGLDNDCNGKVCTSDADCTGGGLCGANGHCVDEGVTLTQNICKDLGPCKGATAKCSGATGWQCAYGADVELQPCTTDADCGGGYTCDTTKGVCPGIVIINEALCDGKDGDCDGLPDDPWSNPALPSAIGKDCDPTKPCATDADCDTTGGSSCINQLCTPKQGECRDVGKYICDPVGKDKTICQLSSAGKAPGTEVCNGKDDNCDGQVDNNVTDEQWVTVGSFQIFMYEASRPDASGTSAGIQSTGRPCSVAGRIPWATISRVEAYQACVLAGARLCTTAEWQQACRGSANTIFPYGNSFKPGECNGRSYDATKDAVLPTDQPASCVSTWGADKIYNMSGNLKEWTATTSTTPPNAYAIRGGAFDTPSIDTNSDGVDDTGDGLSCTYNLPPPPDDPQKPPLRLPTLGFRCCK